MVAALTLPTLIQNYRKHVAMTKLKRFYSTMSQATNLAIAEHGSMEYWDGFTTQYNLDEMQHWFDKYLRKHLKVTSVEPFLDENGEPNGRLKVKFPDGSVMRLGNYAGTVANSNSNYNGLIHASYSLNETVAEDSQRIPCVNTFTFLFYNKARNQYYFHPYSYTLRVKNPTRGQLINDIQSGVTHSCAYLLMLDGWEVKDDYPW